MQTIAMGLLIVVLDVPATGWDWIADPVGWVLVLLGLAAVRGQLPNHRGLTVTAWVCLGVSVVIYPPDSVAHLDDSLGWVFSVPTVAWCFLVCDALHDVADGGRRTTLFWLRNTFAVVAVLPLLVYLATLDWLTVPAAVLAVGANVALVYLLWSTVEDGEAFETSRAVVRDSAAPDPSRTVRPWQTPERVAEREKRGTRTGRGDKGGSPGKGGGITGAEVVARVRKRSKRQQTDPSA